METSRRVGNTVKASDGTTFTVQAEGLGHEQTTNTCRPKKPNAPLNPGPQQETTAEPEAPTPETTKP